MVLIFILVIDKLCFIIVEIRLNFYVKYSKDIWFDGRIKNNLVKVLNLCKEVVFLICVEKRM